MCLRLCPFQPLKYYMMKGVSVTTALLCLIFYVSQLTRHVVNMLEISQVDLEIRFVSVTSWVHVHTHTHTHTQTYTHTHHRLYVPMNYHRYLATKLLLMKVIEVKEGKTTIARSLFVIKFCYMIPALIRSLGSFKKWKSRVHGNMVRNLVFSQLTLQYN